MFTHLIAAKNLSHGQPNLLATTQRFLLTLGGFHDLVNCFSVASSNSFFAAPLFSQQRIATSDQPLAWVGRMLNLGQIRVGRTTTTATRRPAPVADLNGFQC